MEMVGRILMDLRRDVKNIKDSIGHVTDPKKGTGAVSAQALYLEAVLERADKQLQEQSNALVSAAIRRREEMETGTVATSLGLRPPGSSPSGSPPVLAPPLTDRGPNRGPLHLGAGGGSHSAASLTAFELAVDSDDAIKFGLPKQRGGGVYVGVGSASLSLPPLGNSVAEDSFRSGGGGGQGGTLATVSQMTRSALERARSGGYGGREGGTATGLRGNQAKLVKGRILGRPRKLPPKFIRKNPLASRPPLTEADLADGLLGLQERELIPKDADLTPALERGVPVVTTHQVHLGIYQSQFVKGAVADPLPNVGVRFDMHSPLPIPPGAPERARSTQILRAAAAAKGASEGGALAALTDGSADPSSSKPTGSFGQPHQQAGVTASSVLPTGDRTGDVFFTALPEDGELGPEGSGFGGLAAHPSSHRTNTPQQHHRSVEEMLVEPGTLDEHTGAHLILFQKGKFQQRTNEFRAFKKKQAASWSLACQVLRTVEYHLGPFALPYVCFDGDALVEAQRNAHGAEVPLEVLLSCCDQEGLIRKSIAASNALFKIPDHRRAQHNAATCIQRHFRGKTARRNWREYLNAKEAVAIIQEAWQGYKRRHQTRRQIQEIRNDRRILFRQLQFDFASAWPQKMGHRRVEVHICSHCPSEETRKRTPEWHLRQHTQAARMFRAAMARTDVVFVAPRELASELKEYFQKVMVYRGVPQPEGRLQFVVPELVDRCPLGGLDLSTSLMTLLLCSPRALKRIRKLTQGRFSFVVPATPSPRDVEVCALTGLPLFGCDPAKAATFTGKSGIRKLVQAARLPSPVFIPFITDKEEFFVSLATLVLGHPAVSVWVFKIEDEREARGTAFLNVGEMREVKQLRRRAGGLRALQSPMHSGGDTEGQGEGQRQQSVDDIEALCRATLERLLPKKVEICCPELFPSWAAFFSDFTHRGGLIEACPPGTQLGQPTVHIRVDPDGSSHVLSTTEAAGVTRFDRQFTLAPQTAAPLGPLADAARQLGTSMAARGFFGFASVDFAAFEQRVPITPDGVAKMSASSEDLKQHALPDRPPHVPSQQPSPSPSNSNQDGSTDPNMHTETVTGTYTGSGDPGCRTSTSGTASGSALDGKILTSQVGVPREPNLGSGGRGGGKRGLMFGALRSPSPEFPTPASSSPVPPPGDQSLAALSMHLEGKPPSFVPLTLSGVSGSGSGGTVPRGITLSAHGTHQGTSETNDRRSEPLHNGPPPSTTVAQTGTGSASGVTQTCSAADSRALVPAAAVGAEVAVGGSDGGGSRGIPVGERLLRYEVSVGVGEDGQEVEISRGAWVVDVDCWMTDDLAAMQAVHVMAETSVDAQTGKMRMRRDAEADAVTEREGEEGETEEEEIANSQTSLTRNCLFVHKLNVVGVGTLTMGDLFNVAKLRGFSFDLLNNVGTGFLMVDRFEETCSVMMVGVTQRECVDRLPALLSFLVAPTQAFPLTEQIAVQAADRAGGVREQKAHQTSFPVSKGGGGGAADLLVGGGKGTGVSEDSASACRNEGSTVRKCQAALRLLLRLKPQATHSFPSGLLNPS